MVRTVDFAFSDEQIAIRNTARAFIADEIITREAEALRRERQGERRSPWPSCANCSRRPRSSASGACPPRRSTAAWTCRRSLQALIWTEIGRTFVPFRFGGEADNILYYANDEQKAEYLLPTIEGERHLLLRDHRARTPGRTRRTSR